MMSIGTLLKFLFGNRAAILTIARTPAALWLGAIFVLSAAFAREYDGKDLAAEPWHLLVPHVASLVTSFVLFGLIYFIAKARLDQPVPFWRTYRAFLALYWLTAPLAWLYAIPVERFLSAGGAMIANLTLLGVVALWRVVLMIRVVGVLFGTRPLAPVWPVLLFGDSVVLAALYFTPLPMFNIMGGIRLGEREEIILGTAINVGFFGVVTWLVWFAGTLALCLGSRTWHFAINRDQAVESVRPALWALAVGAVLLWLPILPVTQPPQRLRHAVEADFAAGRYDAAIQTVGEHGPKAFPPHWELPPNISYTEAGQPALLDVMEVAINPGTPTWLQELYAAKLDHQMEDWDWFDRHRHDLARLRALLEQIPTGKEILRRHATGLLGQKESWARLEAGSESVSRADELLRWAGCETVPQESRD
jgi:hypothetical protein